jgi:sec-independent protein translocase protein TatB
MFDIGWSEMMVVGAVALVVIGPKDLPGALRQAGKWMGTVRRMASDFQGQVNAAMREAELDELRQQVNTLKSGFTDPVQKHESEMKALVEATPALPPPSELKPEPKAEEPAKPAPKPKAPAKAKPKAPAKSKPAKTAKPAAKTKAAAKPVVKAKPAAKAKAAPSKAKAPVRKKS